MKSYLPSQIVSGHITRSEALEKLKKLLYNQNIEKDKHYVAKKYGITNSELEEYLLLPPKTYKDFPKAISNRIFLQFI